MAKAKRPQQNAQYNGLSNGRQTPSRTSNSATTGSAGSARTSTQRTAQAGAAGKSQAARSATNGAPVANGTAKSASEAQRRYQPLSTRSGSGRATVYRSKPAQPAWWQKNLPLLIAGVTVVLLVAIIVLIARGAGNGPAEIGSAAPASVTAPLTNAPASLYSSVGTGGLPSPFQGQSGAHIGGSNGGGGIAKGPDGKPVFFYAGGEYCPYCAAERWSMVMALSRFGTISNLTLSASTGSDVFPNTPTFTFVGSSYTSKYIDFQPVEESDRSGNALQTPTTQQKQYLTFNNTPYIKNGNGIPFLNFANQYVTNGAGYGPGVLDSLKWQDIANKIKSSPNDPVTQDIVGNANYITAAICQTTGQQPANVCQQAPIPDIEKKL